MLGLVLVLSLHERQQPFAVERQIGEGLVGDDFVPFLLLQLRVVIACRLDELVRLVHLAEYRGVEGTQELGEEAELRVLLEKVLLVAERADVCAGGLLAVFLYERDSVQVLGQPKALFHVRN